MRRIDTHHHVIPPDYRDVLRRAGIDESGGRALPDWSPEGSLQTMAELDVATAILSVSTPGATFLPNPADAVALARDLNDYSAHRVVAQPDRFGFFATIPMPHLDVSVAETVRALDDLKADGVVLLANNAGTYLGHDGQDELWEALDERGGGVHSPGRPTRADRARSCPVRGRLPTRHDTRRISVGAQRCRRKYPKIRFISEPCRRLRPVCLASDGGGDHG
jgi:predicted TIM-barrel fold metal-dependent hydrolase